MPRTRLILVRHGETEWNLQRREMGQLDSPLTTLGIEQAMRIGVRIAAQRPAALYCSDLGRAVQTANLIGRVCGLVPQRDARLRERHYGFFQGLTPLESEMLRPGARAVFRAAGPEEPAPDGGESARQASDRALACFDSLAAAHPDGTVVAVTHGSLLMLILERALDLPFGAGKRFKRPNAAFNLLARSPAGWSVEVWGDTTHLDAVAAT